MSISKFLIDEEAYEFVVNAKSHFEKLRKDAGYENEWTSFEDSYFNGTADFYKGLPRVRVPALRNSVERIVPQMDRVIFPPDGEFFQVDPDDKNNDLQAAEAELAKTFIKDQVRSIGLRTKLVGIERSLCTYGTVFVKTYWEHKIKEKFTRDENGDRVKQFDVTFDNPDLYNISIWDFYADIKDENLEGLVIERIVKDFQSLWTNRLRMEDGEEVGVFHNVDKLREIVHTRETNSNKQTSESIRGLGAHQYGKHEHKVEIFEAWGPIPKYLLTASESDKESMEYVDGRIVIGMCGDKGVTLLISDNPYDHQEKPYLRARYIKVDGRLYGLGVMSGNIPLEAELNTVRNQFIAMLTKNLRPKYLRDRNANIPDAALRDEAEQVIDTDDMNGLRDYRPNDFTAQSIEHNNVVQNDIQDGTGASKILGGSPERTSLERTAFGVSTILQSALGKFELVVTTLEEELLKPLFLRFWQLNQQFLPEGRDVVAGEGELIRVLPSEVQFPRINFIGIKEIAEKEFKLNAGNILIQNITPFAQFGLDPIPIILRQIKLLGWGDLIPEIDKRPENELEETPEGEVQLLLLGRKVKINLNDNHDAYILAYQNLLGQENLPDSVRRNTEEALGQRALAKLMIQNSQEFTRLVQDKKIEQQ